MRFREISETVVYHSGPAGIEQFHPWTHFGSAKAAQHRMKDRREDNVVYTAKLSIRNPLLVTDAQASDEASLLNAIARGEYPLDVHVARSQGVAAACEAAGYDGLVYQNNMEDRGRDSWVIFHPEQAQIV